MKSKVISIGGTTPSSASTATVGTATGLGDFDAISVVLEVVGAAGGTLDLLLESQWEDDTTWYNLYRVPQLASGASSAIYHFTVALSSSVTTIGKDGALTLATSTVRPGHWGDKIRLRATAGASTSAGAAIVCKIIGHRILR